MTLDSPAFRLILNAVEEASDLKRTDLIRGTHKDR
jgi:hypothetical protein